MIDVLVLPPDWNQDDDYRNEYVSEPGFPETEIGGVPVLVSAGHYWSGSYEGDGTALVILEDGRAALYNLGHCSCYGPFEDVSEDDFIDYNELKSNQGSRTDYQYLFDHCEANYAQQ